MIPKIKILVNLVLFIGLATLCVCTIYFMMIFWPSSGGECCEEFCGIPINPEQRYFLLVALGGVLGSFIHVATSFVDFIGNKKMVYSWIPWYLMRPFIGASLAIIFYVLLRACIISTQSVYPTQQDAFVQKDANLRVSSSSIDTDSITLGVGVPTTPAFTGIASSSPPQAPPGHNLPFNPFGIIAVACLSGLFSKQATDKLREVFESLFNIRKKTPRENPLTEEGQNTGAGKST